MSKRVALLSMLPTALPMPAQIRFTCSVSFFVAGVILICTRELFYTLALGFGCEPVIPTLIRGRQIGPRSLSSPSDTFERRRVRKALLSTACYICVAHPNTESDELNALISFQCGGSLLISALVKS